MPFQEGGYDTSSKQEKSKEYLEVGGEKFEVIRPEILNISDIVAGDRTLISTKSGNRYMIRWSKSLNAPKIYNKREGINKEYVMSNTYLTNTTVAEKGKPFSFTTVLNEKMTQEHQATEVTDIEIRKGLDKAIQSGTVQPKGKGLLDMLKEHVNGKIK